MSRPCSAFTLVEVLLATALSAVVLMLLITVSVSVQRGEQHARAHQSQRERYASLVTLLQHDLTHAHTITATGPGLLLLDGYSAIDPVTHAALHAPAQVVYMTLESGQGESVLVRRQIIAGQAPLVELLMYGVGSFELRIHHREQTTRRGRHTPPLNTGTLTLIWTGDERRTLDRPLYW